MMRRLNSKGFSLIELLVAISIFSLLSTFVVASYRGNEKMRQLKNQTDLIGSGLEKVQNMALTGEMVGGMIPQTYKFIISSCQSGCSYKLVAESNTETQLISEVKLAGASIAVDPPNDFAVAFTLPRGKMILPNDLSSANIEVYNNQNSFCVNLNSVSGRIILANGDCQ